MKYFNKSSFKFTDTPFPAFRCELVFGRNKRDFSFIPCNAHTEEGMLFNDTFKVIKTKAKGTIMLVDGKETTNRALCFVSADAGFRGSVSIIGENLCRILSSCHAGNACAETAAAAVVLDIGGYIDFYSTGRRHDFVYRYEFTGEDLVKTSYQKEEYDVLMADAEEAEEI